MSECLWLRVHVQKANGEDSEFFLSRRQVFEAQQLAKHFQVGLSQRCRAVCVHLTKLACLYAQVFAGVSSVWSLFLFKHKPG